MKLEEINQKYDFMNDVCFEHQEGWSKIINQMCESLKFFFDISKTNYGFNILQIKEKFGVLVIYHSVKEDTPEEAKNIIKSIIKYTEGKSHCVCEKCGSYGYLRTDFSWVHTYCDKCEEQLQKELEERKG